MAQAGHVPGLRSAGKGRSGLALPEELGTSPERLVLPRPGQEHA